MPLQSARQAWTYLLCRKVKIIIWNKQRFWGFFLVVYRKLPPFFILLFLILTGIMVNRRYEKKKEVKFGT